MDPEGQHGGVDQRAGYPGGACAFGTTVFDEVFTGNGVRVIKTPVRSPRANSFAERYAGTLRHERLDHMLLYGERHLWRILAEYARHCNEHRPHQPREQRPPLHEPGQPIDMTTRIKHTPCRPRPDQRVPESGLTSTGNARSEPACEFWHGTGVAAGIKGGSEIHRKLRINLRSGGGAA